MATALCFGAFVAAPDALAQTAAPDTDKLPALTVEAPAVPRKKKSTNPKSAPTAQSTSGAGEGAAGAQPAGYGASGSGSAPGANPFADPAAPYKVDRSASSKLGQPLLDTARTVMAIPKEVIEDKGATSLRELVRTTPGLTLGTGEGGNAFGDRVFIRGFDARNDMYINGVRESGVTTRETFTTEQVEIVKGPAGSIGGRGTAGGAVNVVTKQPTTENFQHFSTTFGTDLTRRLTIDLNRKIDDDLSVRVNGMVQGADVAGRDHLTDDRAGGSFALAWKPREDFKATLDFYHVQMDQMPDWGVPFDPRSRRPFTESGLDRNDFYGITARDFQKNRQDLVTQGFEWKPSADVTIANKIRFGYTVSDYIATKPGTPTLSAVDPSLWTVSLAAASLYQINRTAANQTEAKVSFDTGPLKHTALVGVEVQREDISRDGYTGLSVECHPACSGTTVTTNLWNPTSPYYGAGATPSRLGTPTKTAVDTAAVYAFDTLNWTEKVILNIGGRADDYRISRTVYGSSAVTRDDFMLNGNTGLTYKVLPNLAVYAAYATSSNPVGSEVDGGSESYGALGSGNAALSPERNTSLEAGVKWEAFERKLLVTAAAFRTTKDKARESISGVWHDSAAYEIRGVEFGVSGNVTEKLSVFGGAAFMDSEVTQSATASSVGRPLANFAHASVNLMAKYKLTSDLTVGAQATWTGRILGGTLASNWYSPGTVTVSGASTPTPGGYNVLPSGTRIDLLAEYRIDKTFSAKLQVQNVFDKTLYDAFYRSNTPYVYVSPGRVGTLTLQAKF